jgi:hypothetical protein
MKHLHAHVATLAGPARLLQPLDVFDCDALPEKVVAGESMRSVKGSSHTVRHYSLPAASEPARIPEFIPEATSEPKPDSDRLAKFHAFICSKPSAETAPEPSETTAPAQSAADAFKKFMSASSQQSQ